MAQNSNILLPALAYTRSDYTALRACCLKVPINQIGDLYYCEDSPQVKHGLATYRIAMRDPLVERAIEANPDRARNPWTAVKDPLVVRDVDKIHVARALSPEGWGAVVETLTRRGQTEQTAQDRVALAAILLMGDSGLRREEAACAMRMALRPSQHAKGVWMLTALGKRGKRRLVPVSPPRRRRAAGTLAPPAARLPGPWRRHAAVLAGRRPATSATAARHGVGVARPRLHLERYLCAGQISARATAQATGASQSRRRSSRSDSG